MPWRKADRCYGELSGEHVRNVAWVNFYGSRDGRRFLLRQAIGLAIAAMALCAVFGDGQVDLLITRWFFDETRRIFPLTDQWLLKTVLHDAARTTSVVAMLTLIGITVMSWLAERSRPVHAHRQTLLLASTACLAGAATVSMLKHFSSHACPWDLAKFGGTASYHALFATPIATEVIQGCSPAAHPLAGYAWLGVGFALFPVARQMAWQAWTSAFALGSVFGAVQILRGAHFLSHVLWSAWCVWGANVALLIACVYLPARLALKTDSGEHRQPIAEGSRS
jgi:membrane-associated PAP2 superfamily phosphatase